MSKKPEEHYISIVLDDHEYKFVCQLKNFLLTLKQDGKPVISNISMSEFMKLLSMKRAMDMASEFKSELSDSEKELGG